MKRRTNPMPKVKIAKVAKSKLQEDFKTTQAVLEAYFREEYRITGCSPEDTEKMLAAFRQKFPQINNHLPHPELLAMLEAELRESEDFVKRLEQRSAERQK
jgi:hypothetical protein